MASSDGLAGSCGEVDCSAGTIVWVRRRNGSWWPGKILGSDEISPSHLTSPRSGTPVKLLGREDASVDWYNLEKSKRVKAFRCGEFDDCIDKAEKSQGVPIKKREKYARREDAILHALELEREKLEKKQKKQANANSASSKKSLVLKKGSSVSSERLGNGDCKSANLSSQSLLQEESINDPQFVQTSKRGKQSIWQGDISAAVPRMRGLQDFGLRIAPKRKAYDSVAAESSRRPCLVDNHAHVLPIGSQSLGRAGPVTSSKNLMAFKRKRALGGLIEESLVKRRDRRRPLVQVLQSSAKLPANQMLQPDEDKSSSMPGEKEQSGVIWRAKRSRCVYLPAESNDNLDRTESHSDEVPISPPQFGVGNCHIHPGSLTEECTTSGSLEEAESDSSRSHEDREEEQAVHTGSIRTQPMEGQNSGSIERQTESLSSEELDEAADGYMSRYHSHDQAASAAADVGVSKWQLKGKRNIRNLMKGPAIKGEQKSNGSIHETYMQGKGNWSNLRAPAEQSRLQSSAVIGYGYDEDVMIENNPMHNQIPGYGNRRYPSILQGPSKGCDRSSTDIVDSEGNSVWETDGISQAAFRGYWDESDECYDPVYAGPRLGKRKDSVLVDVDLKVQASYQGEHVPLVSLMSRLNGKAIIGHPIQIEVLEDGSSDIYLSTNNDLRKEPIDNDGSTMLPPVWRTARRTAMHRIPRPHPSTALNGDDSGDPLQYSDPEGEFQYNKSQGLHPEQITGKNSECCRPSERKYPKKATKKVSLSWQKTRTLSSFAIEQKLNGNVGGHKVISRSGLDGLIKPESGPTTVTCIPVKLVFSRLLEAVGRPPSRPANHIVPINRGTEIEEEEEAVRIVSWDQ